MEGLGKTYRSLDTLLVNCQAYCYRLLRLSYALKPLIKFGSCWNHCDCSGIFFYRDARW